MSTYVMSDLHGCFDEFLQMLEKIGLQESDRLFLAGDYVDRGPKAAELLKWLERKPSNVFPVRGNHDEEFAGNVDVLILLDQNAGMGTDPLSSREATVLYGTLKQLLKEQNPSAYAYFDMYGGIRQMLEQGACLSDLARWASMIREFPYYRELEINGRTCIIVHAGYTEELPEEVRKYWAPEDFYLYARDEAYLMGGKEHGMIVFGHTPTIVEGMFPYNKGEIFRYHDEEKDCVFYDIDCGCVFRGNNAMARLACLRLEDEAVFYL